MDKWNKIVRIMKDESVKPNRTAEIADRIFQDLKRMRIKDKGKFRQRMGPEYESWIVKLEDDYDSDLVSKCC
jgi:hypothetical protein